MKTEKFLKQYSVEIGKDVSCKLCELHEKFNEKIGFVPCPHCDTPIEPSYSELTVVGEHNGLETKNITKCPVLECSNCGQTVALVPVVIHYNANHDVYYTGEPCFMTFEEDEELEKRIAERMKKSVDQFVRRVKEGENNLTEFYLNLWMSRDVSGAVAEFLYEKGYKKSIAAAGTIRNAGLQPATREIVEIKPDSKPTICPHHRYECCDDGDWRHTCLVEGKIGKMSSESANMYGI